MIIRDLTPETFDAQLALFEERRKSRPDYYDPKFAMVAINGTREIKVLFLDALKKLGWEPYPGKYPIFDPEGLTVDEQILKGSAIATCNSSGSANTYQSYGFHGKTFE